MDVVQARKSAPSRSDARVGQFDFGGPAAEQVDQGWNMTLESLKTLLETGSPPQQ
jgi:hypothetical protein